MVGLLLRIIAVPLFAIGGLALIGGALTIWLDPELNPPYNTGGMPQIIGMVLIAVGAGIYWIAQKVWKKGRFIRR